MKKLTLVILLVLLSPLFVKAQNRPNVVLIVCDDLNDYITGMGGHPQAKTPNIAKLAKSGVAFKRAYSNNPVCAPSRSSFFTGIYGHTSGNLFWNKWFQNPVLKNSKTIMEHFKSNGYHVAGSGKLLHHNSKKVWSEFKHEADYGPVVYDGKARVAHPDVPQPYIKIGPIDGSYGSLANVPYADDNDPKSGWIYGTWRKLTPYNYVDEHNRDLTPDERNAKWAADRIKKFENEKNGKPFFLAVGFIRPHTPLHVPQKYYDMFPLDKVQLPVIKKGDAEDTHYKDLFDAEQKRLRYFREINVSYPDMETAIKTFTQAYLACVAAADDCVGQVVDAIDNSKFKENTIVVFTSDHGWNMGQKDYLFKNSPWEESTRVPFIVRAPGVAKPGGIAEHPISLIDLYPTLADLCGLKGDTRKNDKGAKLDGHSLRPFLENPTTGKWNGPEGALSMIYAGGHTKMDDTKQHWSYRTRRWRYIVYNNGLEELYDHDKYPREWTNLANQPEYDDVKKSLLKQIKELGGARKSKLGN